MRRHGEGGGHSEGGVGDEGGVGGRLDLVLAAVGVLVLVTAIVTRPGDAGAAASQDWSPFVLVTGLLLIGLVADDDGLFAALGHQMARAAPNGTILFLGATVVIGAVTAVLNLDTSVAFLTPVLVYTARSRGEDEAALLYGCLLLSNAGSLFLPGSNLTNLIVLGHLHLSGTAFLTRMWAPALAALVMTALVVAAFERRCFRVTTAELKRAERPVLGLGVLTVGLAIVLVVVLSSPALPVAIVGGTAVGIPPSSQKGPSPPCRPGTRRAGPGWPVRRGRLARHFGTRLVRAGRPTVASRLVGNGLFRRLHLSRRQQPPGRILAFRPHAQAPSLFACRAEPRAEPVRERLTGLVVMVANGSIGSGRAVDRQSQPHRRCRGAAVDGRRSHLARRHRRKLTTRSSRGASSTGSPTSGSSSIEPAASGATAVAAMGVR